MQLGFKAILTFAAIAVSLFLPEIVLGYRYLLLAAILLFIGIPHGAMDHVIDGALENWDSTKLYVPFYAWYLGAISLYVIFWVFFPVVSFFFFLAITAYHFGQADIQFLKFSKKSARVFGFMRGLMIAGFLMLADPGFTSSVIGHIVPLDWAGLVSGVSAEKISLIIPSVYGLMLIGAAIKERNEKILVEIIDTVIVTSLFLIGDIVIAFSLYFGFWHSLEHVKKMASFLLKKGRNELGFTAFYKQAINFSLIIYLATLFLYNMLDAFGESERMIALFLIIISVLTLPHLFVVEKMYNK